jgi:hypothetical protein
MLFPLLLACILSQAPRRTLPETSDINIKAVTVPAVVSKGEKAIFTVSTQPGNKCVGAVGYTDTDKSKWVWVDLPEMIVDQSGLCTWEWTAPYSSQAGIAEYRATAEHEGLSGNLILETFCIDACP